MINDKKAKSSNREWAISISIVSCVVAFSAIVVSCVQCSSNQRFTKHENKKQETFEEEQREKQRDFFKKIQEQRRAYEKKQDEPELHYYTLANLPESGLFSQRIAIANSGNNQAVVHTINFVLKPQETYRVCKYIPGPSSLKRPPLLSVNIDRKSWDKKKQEYYHVHKEPFVIAGHETIYVSLSAEGNNEKSLSGEMIICYGEKAIHVPVWMNRKHPDS